MASLLVLSSLRWTVFSNLLFTDALTCWRSQPHAVVSLSTSLHDPGPQVDVKGRLPLDAAPQLKSAMRTSESPLFLAPKDFPFFFTSCTVGVWEGVNVRMCNCM